MAIFTAGPMAGQISGRVGSVVFSHNKGGPYVRNGTKPTKVANERAAAVRTRLTLASQAWQGLTDAQRASWKTWCMVNTVTNRLGHQVLMPPNAAFVKLNTRLLQSTDSTLGEPPVSVAPEGPTGFSATYDIGAGTFEIAFAPTPCGATNRLWLRGWVTDSPAITYLENRLVNVMISSLNHVTGMDVQSYVEAVYGVLAVGETVHLELCFIDSLTGQLSPAMRTHGVVVET